MENQTKPRTLGLIGTVLGLVALGVAVFHFFIGPIEPPPPVESVVAETTAKLKSALEAKLGGKEYQPPVQQKTALGPDKIIEYSIIAIGFMAIAFGVFGFIQHESWRPSGMAMALGGGALAFQFAIAIIGAVLGVILIGMIVAALVSGGA